MSLKNKVRALMRRRLGRLLVAALAAVSVATLALLPAGPASAHCDSVNGPVATAAQSALKSNDVKLILPYVKPEQEKELTAAFQQTVTIRQRGPEVQGVADRWFVETAVRLHRVGEGASFTGLRDEEPNPALEAADASLRDGKPDAALSYLDTELRQQIAEKYQKVLDARAAEAANPGVETARARVEATFMFEKYILGIHTAIEGVAHEEGSAGGDHTG